MLQLLSGAAFAAVVTKSEATSQGLFGDLSALTVLPLVGSLLFFVFMVAHGAWRQALATLVAGCGLLAVITFLLPIVGLLVATVFGPWLLLIVFVVACALSRDAMRAHSRLR